MATYKNVYLDSVDDTILAYLKYVLKYDIVSISKHDYENSKKEENSDFTVWFRHIKDEGEYQKNEPLSLNIWLKDFSPFRRKIMAKMLTEEPTFEESIHSKEDLKKIYDLRIKADAERVFKKNAADHRKEFINTLQMKSKIWYKGQPSIITYRHNPDKNGIVKFTIKSGDDLFERIDPNGYYGAKISHRHVEDLSNVLVSPEIQKKSTVELLGMRYKGYLSDQVRAELSRRPHIPKTKEKKIKRLKEGRKHSSNKSKSR